MATWKKKVRDIIDASQESENAHERLLKDLREIYDSTDKKPFTQEFLRLLVYPVSVDDKSTFIDNCLSFLVKFTVCSTPCNSDMDEDGDDGESTMDINSPTGFFVAVLNFVISILPSTNKAVRSRGCQFLGRLLSECSTRERSGVLSNRIWNQLTIALVERCKDKVVRVRYNAIAALSKLQQPKDVDCPAIAVIMFLMRYDPNADVRCQCMRLISSTKATISCFVERCRTGNVAVRTTLYKQIAERKLFKFLTVRQRLTVIKHGLTDPVESVRMACEIDMINSWLEAVQGDIPDLVNRLDMITSRKTCELLLDSLFKQKPPAYFVDIFAAMTDSWENYEWIKPERVFCLRHFIRFITATQKSSDPKRRFAAAEIDEWMEKLVPTLYPLVDYIETYITKDTESEELDMVDGALLRNFSVCQFIQLLTLVDKSDAAGLNRLRKMFETVVSVVSPSVLPDLVRLHFDWHRNVERTIEWMAEAISDWTAVPTPAQPIGVGFPDQTVSCLPLDGLRLEDELDGDKLDSDANLFKSLTILSEVLKLANVKTLTTTLRSLYENLVLPSIQNEDPATRNLAFRCLGLSCLLDRTLASKHIDLFLQTLKVDVEAVRKTSVEVLFDLLLVFRERIFEDLPPETEPKGQNGDGESKKKTAQMVVSEMLDILDSDDTELHDVVAEGEAKLRLYAPKLVPPKPRDE